MVTVIVFNIPASDHNCPQIQCADNILASVFTRMLHALPCLMHTLSDAHLYVGAAGGASPEEDPHYFDALPHRPKQAAADQWAWIEAQLAASKAQYVLVGGHYSL